MVIRETPSARLIDKTKGGLPWQMKLIAKLILSRLPVSYAFWRSLNLFRHGAMDDPERCLTSFQTLCAQAGIGPDLHDRRVLELGPGDSLATSVLAFAHGCKQTTLVDVGVFATQNMHFYRRLAELLTGRRPELRAVSNCRNTDELMTVVGGRYLTGGLQSLRQIESASAELIFSVAVLEHVRRHEFLPVLQELKRILSPGGTMIHYVDLKDHISGGLNNLRFGSQFWESDIVANSGFYTNRIAYSEMSDLFSQVGFDFRIASLTRFSKPQLKRSQLAKEFRNRHAVDLEIAGFVVLMKLKDNADQV
jgi:SAM-dependent methyltransferase